MTNDRESESVCRTQVGNLRGVLSHGYMPTRCLRMGVDCRGWNLVPFPEASTLACLEERGPSVGPKEHSTQSCLLTEKHLSAPQAGEWDLSGRDAKNEHKIGPLGPNAVATEKRKNDGQKND